MLLAAAPWLRLVTKLTEPLQVPESVTGGVAGAVVIMVLMFLPVWVVAFGTFGILSRLFGPEAPDGETRCRKCGYILRGITEPRCPECGERI